MSIPCLPSDAITLVALSTPLDSLLSPKWDAPLSLWQISKYVQPFYAWALRWPSWMYCIDHVLSARAAAEALAAIAFFSSYHGNLGNSMSTVLPCQYDSILC
jgi:hypothetical protein